DYESSYSEVWKDGYVPQVPLGFKRGQENNIDVRLAPINGTLRLEVVNQSGQFSSIYVIVENPSFIAGVGQLGKIFADSFPITLPVSGNYIEYFNLPSEEFTRIHWGFSYFTSLSASPFQDSVFLILQDTTTYKLIY